jgi:hypothetical protein
MALPIIADLKLALRVETDAEDALFTGWIARAQALVEGLLQRPLAASDTAVSYVVTPSCHAVYGPATLLVLPVSPISDATADVSVTDADGTLVATSDYTIDGARAWLVAKVASDVVFGSAWYTVTAKPGLDQAADYATRIEPLLSQAITDTVADWYHHRNPDASVSTAGGGISVTYQNTGLPARVVAMLAPLMPPRVR